eukprot:8230911-Pyramimonas_sp.AAC.1
MRQADASDVSESIPVLPALQPPPLTARVKCRKPTAPLRMLSIRKVDAPDVSESDPVIASNAAPLQRELSAENRQHLSI